MAAVWMRLRAEVRGRWRAMVGLSLLLAVMAGAATAAAAGARRTETAYPRFFERYHAGDLVISTGGHPSGDEAFAVAASLPQVESVERFSIYSGTVRAPSGKEATFPDAFFIGEHKRDSSGDFLKVVDGRLSDPATANEAMVNYAMADRLAIETGDTVMLTLAGLEDDAPAPPEEMEIRITGIVAMIGSFESVTGGGFPTTFLMTPAFQQRWHDFASPGEDNLGILLRRGEADIDSYVAALHRELERRGLADVLDGEPQRTSAETPGVQALNRVPAVALWLLCGFIGITAIAVFSQLLGRETRAGAEDHPTLHALGMPREQLTAISILRSLLVVGSGAVLSIGVAVLLSPLTPVGLARIAEPEPGFTVAPLILGLGALATLILVSGAALYPAWAAARSASKPRDEEAVVRPTFLAGRLARTPIGLSARSGLRMAVETGRGARAVPVRTAILGTTISVGALAAALTFAGSLDYLIGEPKLAGYSWDAGAIANGFDAPSQAASIREIERSIRERMPSAKVWKGSVFAAASVEGIDVSVYVSDGPDPSIIEGRAPHGLAEAAVDPRTLRRLHKRIGDEVKVAPFTEAGESEPAVPMRLVGLFAVPRIAFQFVNPGQGIALTPAGFGRMNPNGEYAEAVYADFPPETDFQRGLDEFRNAAGDAAFLIVNRQQSATVGNVERISALPLVLAAIMGLLGIATLAHALSTTIRQRRRDLAILKTLGFIGRQVRATIAWQSTVLVVASLLVGLPLGVAAGRWGWRLFTQQLQVVPVSTVSTLVLASVASGGILLANVIAAFPARIAARIEPALVLRTE